MNIYKKWSSISFPFIFFFIIFKEKKKKRVFLLFFPGNWLHTLRHPEHRSKKPPLHSAETRTKGYRRKILFFLFLGRRRRRSRSNNSSRVVETHSTEHKNTNPIMYSTKSKPRGHTRDERDTKKKRRKDEKSAEHASRTWTQGTHTHTHRKI